MKNGKQERGDSMDFDSKPKVIRDEGYRNLRARHGHAKAGYRIEQMADGSFRVSIRVAYGVGDFHGFGSPRIEMKTRDDCVQSFLDAARNHFSKLLTGSVVTDRQRTSQKQMLSLPDAGLFGFLEPDPEEAP
ncbi:hypothetical protein C2E31_01700 [Rhodopirellula baltica]|nr:hypothetical protein C2E31_01700 [Rhodopirellula baltica]